MGHGFMKKHNKKLITLLLAGAFCCTAAIGVASLQSVRTFADGAASDSSSEQTEKQYALSELFTSNALVKDQEQATLKLGNNGKADYRHSMALKWFDGTKDSQDKLVTKYFTLKFAFADADFKTLTLSVDTASSVATEAGKATNKVKFTKLSVAGNKLTLKVSVLADDDEEKEICTSLEVDLGEVLTLSLTESNACQYSDQFEVLLKKGDTLLNTSSAVFKNVGANYAAYSTTDKKEKYPLQWTAETEVTDETASKPENEQQYKETKITIHELNGQSFAGASDNSVADTAAPVLVINEDVRGFLLGAPLSWTSTITQDTVPQYVVIDVVKKTVSDTKIEYYQYNPTDELENGKPAYSTFKFDYKLMPTVYELQDGTKTTVFDTEIDGEKGREFISIRFLLNDEVNKDVEYQLAWYADESALETIASNEYIIINRAKEGAKFAKGNGEFDAYVKAEGGVNKYLTEAQDGTLSYVSEKETDAYENSKLAKFVEEYNTLLEKKAADIYAGSGAEMQFPTLEGLFYDDNGYRNLSFTICYKTENSGPSSESVSYSGLKLKTESVGMYEVKIFATDKAENKMRLYDKDGNLVDVTSSNVWDIDAIPTFTFTVNSQGLKIKNETSETSKATTKAIGETYTFSNLTVVGGAENQQTEYALFKINMEKWGKLSAKSSSFTSVKYEEIRTHIQKNKLLAQVGEGKTYENYFDLYLNVYATFLAEDVGLKDKVDDVLACFEIINAYNDRITEDDPEWEVYNKYKFEDNSFKILDDGGVYIMFAEYYDDENENFARVAGYKVVKAEEKRDVNVGDTEWLKNNLVSIILFSIAAVMLVIIIILLFIKPSDETLEDVDEKVKDKKEEKETKK